MKTRLLSHLSLFGFSLFVALSVPQAVRAGTSSDTLVPGDMRTIRVTVQANYSSNPDDLYAGTTPGAPAAGVPVKWWFPPQSAESTLDSNGNYVFEMQVPRDVSETLTVDACKIVDGFSSPTKYYEANVSVYIPASEFDQDYVVSLTLKKNKS